MKKNKHVLGGIDGKWEGRITGVGKYNTYSIKWLTGPLEGRDARVCRTTVKKKELKK